MAAVAAQGAPASEVTTPSGLGIRYFVEPKRKYEVCKVGPRAKWREVPSVTTVLECLDKPALVWWGMTTGVEALKTLVGMNLITIGSDGETYGFVEVGGEGVFLDKYINESGDTKDALVDLVNRRQLTVNHVKNQAANRGTGVHNALEAWAAIGKVPDPLDFPWEERGYVVGLAAFLQDAAAGHLESEMMEVTVASAKHGYAGRFDLLARTTEPMRVVTRTYPKNPPKYTVVPPSRLLIDLKTSKEIYPTHFLQLEGYEEGLKECGYGATDARAVLHVKADGRYEFRRSRASHKAFLAVLATHNAMRDVKEGMRTL